MEKLNVPAVAKESRVIDPEGVVSLLAVDKSRFYSWGVNEIKAFNFSNTKDIKTIRLKVDGFKHSGYVYIFLNGLDLFDFYLTDLSDKIVGAKSNLYFDQLADVIDGEIEKTEDYEQKVEDTYKRKPYKPF